MRTLLNRRALLGRSLAFGAAASLTGCDYDDLKHPDLADRALTAMSRWNDEVQAALFDRHTLAPTFPASAITRPPRFNAFYSIDQAPRVDLATWRLGLTGRIGDKRHWRLAELRALPQESQITRLACVEGWRVVGQWSGVPLGHFLRRVNADLKARYVSFQCADGYYESIDMASALHPQTILALDFLGAPLTAPFGAPVRLRIPTKLGYKNPKSIVALGVTNTFPSGYWVRQGYNWFGGS
ncbi:MULTISPECIES: molybdopterin-dependent oxidoreductase [unclassified Acidiphilium]|uniref:molybdopterin-dependent oxidoreductase n=1 Tax=unclassified Acidiphilium TaxID=2617493 RepID=UPI000BD912F9|nr:MULTISPECIES: molybdopterin-dependent oxidoreductase [unclassified Acidiphilium]OYV57760.1 MAG: molybdopterin-binding protein [Acidiphilium sp. 20-67-58]HQT60065.1 molybdopterin-dependent oxidoreductase [Acidiphilium sp.]